MLMLSRRAYTLIEMLIVVAIIAILTAIAVPNLLEFQTRARVSAAMSDLRSLATAMEAYRLDHTHYPVPTDENGNQMGSPFTTAFYDTKMSNMLTTPVSFMNGSIQEPFYSQERTEDRRFHCSTRMYAAYQGGAFGPTGVEGFHNTVTAYGGSATESLFFALSHGPDLDHEVIGSLDTVCLYDATNGTVSNGDLVYVGPVQGFQTTAGR